MNKEYEIYCEAFDIKNAEERKNFISEKCGGDQKLFENLMRLFPEDEAARDEDVYGKYKIEREIGKGGMGVVYLASYTEVFADDTFIRKVALKTIHTEQKTDAKNVRKFLQEIKTLAELDHPNIARFLDIGTSEKGKPFFIMEYVDGISLTEYCNAEKLSIRERLASFREILGAIDYFHRRGFIHCDIKPNNILVDSRGTPKVIDFGIASKYGSFISDKTAQSETFAQQAFTFAYASPEQIKGERNLSEQTDIYSLGVVLYEVLTGRIPVIFDRLDSYKQLIETSETADPPHLKKALGELRDEAEKKKIYLERDCRTFSELKENLDDELDEIVQKALARKPVKRYESVRKFDAEIGEMLAADSFTKQLKGAFSALYRKTTRRVRRIPGKWALPAIFALVITLGALSQIGVVRTIPFYLRQKFSSDGTRINLSGDQTQSLDKAISDQRASLANHFAEASMQLNQGRITETHNIWSYSDLVNALAGANYPLDANFVDGIFEKTAAPEGCWKEEKVDCKLAVSGWVLLSKKYLKKPLTSAQLEFILKNQSPAGWFPAYPSLEKSENAATYPTAIVIWGLAEHLRADLVEAKNREIVKRAVEKGAAWLLKNRNKAANQFIWSDCPESEPTAQTQSYGLDGVVIYALHNVGKTDSLEIENFAAELRAIDSRWLENLEKMPRPALEDAAGCRCGTIIGDSVILDRTNQWTVPWSIAATIEAFPAGSDWQKAVAARWLENLPLAEEYRGRYYGASEYLIALNILRKNIK